MDLATHQRALADLIESGSLHGSSADDAYLRQVAHSPGLRVVREIIAHWEAYDVRRSCPLTATALDLAGRLDQLLHVIPFGATSAFSESRSRLFLEQTAAREHGLIRSIARFELALLLVTRGDQHRHVIDWDRDPRLLIDRLTQGRWSPDQARPGRYRTIIAAEIPGFIAIETAN